jgi:hypothetical protein
LTNSSLGLSSLTDFDERYLSAILLEGILGQ